MSEKKIDSSETCESSSEGVEKVTVKGVAFVDGSFNPKKKIYGFGAFLKVGDKEYILQGYGNDSSLLAMRNVAGEILGSAAVMKKAIELKVDELEIVYDYQGIKEWALGTWKRNKVGTKNYHEYYNSIKDKIKITFTKVTAHSGIKGNERADALAKQAVGVCSTLMNNILIVIIFIYYFYVTC